jgi:glycosyltransferase involved in cell wall biosynthesis
MRVLFVSNLFPPDVNGGYELACADVVGAMAERGHDVAVLTSSPRRPLDHDDRRVLRWLRFEDIGDLALFARRDGRAHELAMARAMLVDRHNVHMLRLAVEAHAPDVVYLWNLVGIGGLALALAVDLRGLPWAWQLMDGGPKDLAAAAGPANAPAALALFTRRLRGTWIACSHRLIGEITDAGADLGERVEVIHNWTAGPAPAAPREWWVPGRPLRCVCAARLAEEKGVAIAIDAVGRLVAEGADIRLDVYGTGPERPRLEAQARAAAPGAVRFLGMIPRADLAERFDGHDVFLFPTWAREPFAVTPLEAAARGCIPVVTAGSGNAEWFRDGDDILLAERTADAFARVLRRIVGGEVDLAGIGARAQERVSSDFRLDTAAARMAELLAEAPRPPGPPLPWADIQRLAGLADRLAQVV